MQLLRLELYRIFRRPRTYISFGTITAIVVLIQLAMWANGQEFVDFVLQGMQQDFEIGGKLLSGYFVTFQILIMLLVHVPLLIAMVAGDAVAGESAQGTLRMLLSKPVSRTKLLLVKFGAATIYSWLLLIWLAIMGLLGSLLVFGNGDMIVARSTDVFIYTQNDILWRYGFAFGFAALSMTTITALALFFSVFADNAIGPIITTMGVIIVFTIIDTLTVPLFAKVKPYLFTSHMLGWKGFFYTPIPEAALWKSVAVLMGYILLFLGGAIYFFNKKDIQS